MLERSPSNMAEGSGGGVRRLGGVPKEEKFPEEEDENIMAGGSAGGAATGCWVAAASGARRVVFVGLFCGVRGDFLGSSSSSLSSSLLLLLLPLLLNDVPLSSESALTSFSLLTVSSEGAPFSELLFSLPCASPTVLFEELRTTPPFVAARGATG